MIYLSQTGLKLVLTINPYISTNSENFGVGVEGQKISEENSSILLKTHLISNQKINKSTLLYLINCLYFLFQQLFKYFVLEQKLVIFFCCFWKIEDTIIFFWNFLTFKDELFVKERNSTAYKVPALTWIKDVASAGLLDITSNNSVKWLKSALKNLKKLDSENILFNLDTGNTFHMPTYYKVM